MEDNRPAVLCIDDEAGILSALKRLLRRENYRLLTARSTDAGLKILSEENERIHVVITDQRMPEMDGVTLLRRVKEAYPDIIRITLTGYTDVDSIREAVNQGHIFKFLLKPWNDENLVLEIRQALKQYELVNANRELNEKVMAQNRELKHLNDHLESLVRERTEEVMIRNKALELEQAILADLPMPIVGISAEGMVAMKNHAVEAMFEKHDTVEVGSLVEDCFPGEIARQVRRALAEQAPRDIGPRLLAGEDCRVQCVPLSGSFKGRGIILAFYRNG